MRRHPTTMVRPTIGTARRRSLAAGLAGLVALTVAVTGWAPTADAARPPVLVFTPAPFNYGTVAKGATVSQTFTLTNTGGSAAAKLTLSLAGSPAFTLVPVVDDDDHDMPGVDDDSAEHDPTADSCSDESLKPGRSCTVTVIYHPTTDGATDSATLTATARKRAAVATVALSGSTPAAVVETVTVTGPGDQATRTGDPVSLQVVAIDSIGAPLTYTATGLPPGLAIDPGTGLITGSITTRGTYAVTVSARSANGVSADAVFTWTVKDACPAGQLLGNPGFEEGPLVAWTASPNVILGFAPAEQAHTGTWFAWLSGFAVANTQTLSQTVTLPADCASYTLSFWLHIDTDEITATPFDTLQVQVGSTTLATFSNVDQQAGYSLHTYDLAAFAGQTVTLTFTGVEDSALQTSFVIDDAAIAVS